MDVLDVTEELTLNDVEVRHIISVPGFRGNSTNIFVFIDKNAETYYWVTASYQPFEVGKIYDIQCKCDRGRNNRLSYVKIIGTGSKKTVQSEQPDRKPDAEDVLLGLKDYWYTLDFKLKVLYNTVERRDRYE